MSTQQIRVLIVDNNELFRQGLASLLTGSEQILVVGQARDGAEAAVKTELLRPTVILMDIAMPRGGGVEATRQIKAAHPDVAIAMLTVSENEDDLFAAIRSGARGYILKGASTHELEVAIRTLAAGGAIVTPRLASRVLAVYSQAAKRTSNGQNGTKMLSPREREVLELVGQGYGNKEIAKRLCIADNTVKVHIRNIFEKLQIENRAQAAVLAVQDGLVQDVRG